MRVLIVEDYDLLRRSLAQGLREAGFAVDEAGDGNTGWWHASGGAFDVIILDLMLPGMDGLTLLRKLRATASSACVLVLTARDALEDRIRGLNLGADDYLVKPFAFKELLARVRALVRRKYAAPSPVIQVQDLEVNTLTKSARRDGRDVSLSAREFALLELLAIRAGQVVTRAQVCQCVYDFDGERESNVVDVYIAHLRRKLERPGLARIIHTRRGQGYVLGAAGE